MIIQEAKDIKKSKERIKSLLESLKSKKHIAITLEICSRCNLKCSFCDLHSGRLKDVEAQKGIMSEELYQKIIGNIFDLGYKLKALHFQGNGEPLIQSKLPEMIKLAYDKGVSEKYILVTNGTLMDEIFFEKILASGLDEIHVSLDTVDPIKYLEIKGQDFVGRVIKNIDYAISRISSQEKIKLYIKIPVATPQGDYGLSNEDTQEAIKKYKDIENPNVNIKLMPLSLQGDGVILRRKNYNQPCEQAFYMAYIKFDGRVSICCVDINDDLNIGRIPDQSLSEILNGDTLKRIRKIHIENRLSEIPLCFYCGARPVVDLKPYAEEIKKYI